ncbi:MAG: hypothetical protein V4700_00425 [Pseudomonadota bacterium]
MLDTKEFIDQLAKDNEAFYNKQKKWAKSYWPDKLSHEALIISLKTRFWNELLGAEAIARFMLKLDNVNLKILVGRQVGDEAKHSHYVKKRIEALGGNIGEPLKEQLDYIETLDSFDYPEQFFAAQQFTVETQSIKRNKQAEDTLDKETVEMFKKHVNNDEVFHSRLGYLGLTYYCTNELSQTKAKEAAKLICEKHMAISLANYNLLKSHSCLVGSSLYE